MSINININNKTLCDERNKNKDQDKNKSTKKIIISKYLNKSMVRKKSIVQKSKNNNRESNNFESSPIFKRDSSNYKYNCNCVPFKFNKKNCPINTKSINHNISNSNYFHEYDNVNSSYINN